MKKATVSAVIFAAVVLAGCAETPDLAYMSRQEVSSAIAECENAGQRATVIYAKSRWNGQRIPQPVDVQCTPRSGVAGVVRG